LMREGKIIGLDTPEALKKSSFPTDVLEFDPKVRLSFADILEIKNSHLFSFFEPYGLRFHTVIRDVEAWKKVKSSYEEKFHIRSIPPSMEDVFIHNVEGGSP